MRLEIMLEPIKYIELLRSAASLAPKCQAVFTGRLKRIPMKYITNEFAFSFADDGWNYFRALVAEYEKYPNAPFQNSSFCRFFEDDRVRSIRYLNDVLFLHDPKKRSRTDGYKFYLGTYPWGDHVGGGPWGHYFDHLEKKLTRDLYGYRGNIWYQPGDHFPIEIEWNKTTQLYDSIKERYRPFKSGELPEVTLLVRRDGEVRAIRYNGQHRLSILSHLGYEKITVTVPSARAISDELATWPTFSPIPKKVHEREVIVRENEVKDWHYVKHGLCTMDQALEIFHAFFELNGRERISYLGLPSVY